MGMERLSVGEFERSPAFNFSISPTVNLRAVRGPGLVRQFYSLLELLGYDRLSQRLRREAETAARRGDRGASDFLADLRHEQELMA